MKQTFRLTESELKHMISECMKNILLEDDFKQVDNLNDYVASNGLQMRPASKFQRVNAQSGKSYINQYGKQHGMDKRQIGRMVRRGGAPLSTVAGDGTQETNNMVTKNHTVLNNVGNTNNRWAAETPTFKRKYEQDPTQQGVYKQKGGPMNAAQINEPISFTAPWGQKMNIDKGGYILQDPNDPNDIYGISGKDFDDTYRFDENKQYNKNRNMKQTIKLREPELKRMISESVRRILREMDNDYEGNDLDYDSIQMQAMSVIPRMHQNGQDVSWRSVAEEMGFRLETLNGEDMELLKDAIEDTIMEDENPYWREDMEFEDDFLNLPYVNESINRIVNESLKRVVNEVSGWALEKEDVTWVNDAEDGASDNAWMVRLWPGSGYYLPAFGAYATSEQDALEKVVAYLDKEGDDSFFFDEYVEEMKEELAQEGKDEEDIWKEIDQQFCYVDSTMDGGGCHYVCWENLAVYPYDEKKFR